MDHGMPAPVLSRTLPLEGVTIIAVEQYGAGPFGTMLLADLGAEVIKIENPAEGARSAAMSGRICLGPATASSIKPSTATSAA